MAPKTILITGASGGLGAALARAHAAPGAVLLLWGRDGVRLREIAAQCSAQGAVAHVTAFDIRDIAALTANLAAADVQTPIDLAIFNAGLGGTVADDALSENPQGAQATAEVNFVSPVVGASAIAGAMAKRGRGHIVLIGSIAESFPLPMAPTYAATKAGLAMFAEALSIRMAKHNVAVTLVSPGFIDTPMSRQVPPPKPFLMSADDAARIIAAKIARRARRIVLPWQFIPLRALTRLLPRAVLRLILSRA
ncbi:MAG: family NAD(P)-dependent oxidoreductase [Alphaproteobacteria bacterium]|nr:family NAD(P)-dependent oxidoreductase [Alphaproteobacteria bacterium]